MLHYWNIRILKTTGIMHSIANRIGEIKNIATKNASSMDETLHAYERVNHLTAELNRGLDKFRT